MPNKCQKFGYITKFMGFIVQQLRYIIFFIFIVLRFPKPMSCQMQKRITSKTAADFSLRASGHYSNFQIFLLKTFLIYFNVRVSRSELKLKQTAVTNLMVVTAMSTSEARAKLLELDSRRKSLEEELKLVSHVFLVRILVWLFQQR